ncbi:unnamed protein product [Darwinula stevensoni]|uniref:Alanine--glyoxylate aminotransferase 2, mitochondrial n=1 Tax=Darwinula stevensoni TaxID=69355 RepID=A0A7R9ADR6_9CRUS|nr:unnamed protein product [Darwinula stevensoni]CAG0901012.1 unnamed protein product [Darwinula stevensoni]
MLGAASPFRRLSGVVRPAIPRGFVAGRFVRGVSTEVPAMPHCDFHPSSFQGPSLENDLEFRRQHQIPNMMTTAYYKKPVRVHQGHMQWLWDTEGNRYLDMFGGIVTVSVGHCHPKVVQAAKDQLDRLWHTTHIYIQPTLKEYTEKLLAKMPGDLKVCFLVNSGSEANDLAMFMSRVHTGAFDIVGFRNAFHGMSPYVMGLTALSTWRHRLPSAFGIHHTVNPDPYRGPWGGKACRDSSIQTTRKCTCQEGECQAEDKYVEQVEDLFRYSIAKGNLAAFFAESIQGVGGTVQYPKNFIKRVYELVKNHGGLFVSDEVQTGFGRTGDHFWGFRGHGITPDIVTMAKGIGNGFPLAAVVTTKEIAASVGKAAYFNTFGGNPVACAVGSAVLDVIKDENTQARCYGVGAHFLSELAKLREEFPENVGDVRGKGLMIGVEMVEDKESRTPLKPERMMALFEDIKDMGVLLGLGGLHKNVFRIKPPMCISKEDANFAVQVMRVALSRMK